MTKSQSILSLGCREKGENRTEWDFEVWSKPYGLSDLHYTAGSHIVSYAVEMEDEYWRKRLDEHLLARVAQAGWAVLHGLRQGNAHEGVFNAEYRIRLGTV